MAKGRSGLERERQRAEGRNSQNNTPPAPAQPAAVTRTSVVAQSGQTIDLTGIPLTYGNNDPALGGAMRKNVLAQEQKRSKAKTEYAMLYDANGQPVSRELHGGKGSVNIPYSALVRASAMTHNHPRGKGEEGVLGGTFSNADLQTFARNRFGTIRASAAEGTYSMTKGSNFKAQAFSAFASQTSKKHQSAYTAAMKKYNSDSASKLRSGKMKYSDYQKGAFKLFNTMLVNMHNDLLAGQKQYGYTYTLEG